MASGIYKNGVAIEVSYQAVACATGKTVTMDVYDEAHAKDVAKCVAAMTEYASTGRYYASFTPDAEGNWLVIMENTTDNNGEVLKLFEVCGQDLDSVGDAVDAIKAVTDVESGVKAAVDALNDVSTAEIATELETYDGPTKDEMDTAHALLATEAKQDVIDGFHDVPSEDAATDAQMRDVVGKKTDTVAGTSVIALAKQVLADTGSTGSIRGADDDTLKSLSDQIDAVSAPAMVG